jgi:hypothetical protein
LNAPVSKTGMGFQSIGGSNPPLSVYKSLIPCSGRELGRCLTGLSSGERAIRLQPLLLGVGPPTSKLTRLSSSVDDVPTSTVYRPGETVKLPAPVL